MKIPGFDILDKLGEGGMAVVWKARQVSLDRIVAIKILKPQFAENPNEVKDFIFEAQSAAKLIHPNVVQVYDFGKIENTCYFVMEYVAGPTVAEKIENEGPVPQKMALKIAKSVADALDWAWRKYRLMHRDVKPDNIMIDKDATVKLADLGLAKIAGHPSAQAGPQDGIIEGTPNYMSPEQAKFTAKLSCRTDMYSLGASLYHMTTGVVPFDGHDPDETLQMHLTDHIPNPRDINPTITPGMAQFIARLMMKEPKNRYSSWADVAQDVKKISQNRVMITKKTGAEMDSTVSPPTPRAAPSTAIEERSRSRFSWAPKLAWAALIVLWALYLAGELKLPDYKPRYSSSPAIGSASSGALSGSEGAGTKLAESAERPAGPESSPGAQAAAPGADAAATDAELLDSTKTDAVNCLLAEDFVSAVYAIEKAKGKLRSDSVRTELAGLGKFAREISQMPLALESAFRDKIGREITVTYKKRPTKMTVRAISGEMVNAALADEAGASGDGASVTFPLSQLDPLERNKWLGPANTPAKCAMKYILCMKSGDYDSAKTYASNCGPFSESFIKEAEAKSGAGSR